MSRPKRNGPRGPDLEPRGNAGIRLLCPYRRQVCQQRMGLAVLDAPHVHPG